MQNFDVQHNVASKQSAFGCVDNMFSFVTMGRHIVLCFQRFVQHLDQTLEKVVNTLSTCLKCIVTAFKMHYNTVFVNPGFLK